MKTILTALFSILFFLQGFSQSLPINYQAVIRDNQGAILANEAVTLRFSLLQGSASGTAVYLEEHQETTNQFGLINIQLGTGIVLGGDFYQIDWSLLDYFLKLEIQNGNGQGFTDLGTSKFVAVPYANFALNAANVNNNDTSASNELQSLSINNNVISLDKSGGTVDLTPYLDNTDSQTLTRTGNQISISGGNNITLPTDQVFDGDSSVFNELQAISFANDTLTLSNGGKVYLGAYDNSQAILFNVTQLVSISNKQKADSALLLNLIQLNGNAISNNTNQLLLLSQKVTSDSLNLQNQINTHIGLDNDLDSLNELQVLSISNDTVYLSKGGFIVLPNDEVNDADSNPSNEIQAISISNDTIYLSGGGFVVLPQDNVDDADNNPNNELQVLSISNDTIHLTNGGFAVLPTDNVNDADADNTNEIQTLSISNDTVFLANGGFIVLPLDEVNDIDADTTNEVQSLSLNGNSLSISKGNSVLLPSDNDTSSLNEIQALSINNDTIHLSNGGFVVLPTDQVNDADSNPTNELQILSISNDSLKLSNGGFVDLTNYDNIQAILELYSKVQNDSVIFSNHINTNSNNIALNGSKFDTTNQILENHLTNDLDIDSLNEIQALTISNDTLFLENGGFVDLSNFRDYNSLTNKPESLSDFANDVGFLTNQNTSSYQKGDTAFGGLIVYISPTGTSGLIVALKDQHWNTNWWQAGNHVADSARHEAIGRSFTDWRVPTLNELILLHKNKSLIGNFTNRVYYSSTSYHETSVYAINFSNSTIDSYYPNTYTNYGNKDYFHAVRAVRSFGSENIIIPENLDNDSTNEIQALSISKDTINLSNGGFVVLPTDQVNDADNNPFNELQILSISNDSLKLSNGGFVDLTNYDNMQAVLGLYNKLKIDSAIFSNLINTNSNNIAFNGYQIDTTNQVLENHLANDLDIDSLNEIQNLSLNADTLTISKGNSLKMPFIRTLGNNSNYSFDLNFPLGLSDSVFCIQTGSPGFVVPQNKVLFTTSVITGNIVVNRNGVVSSGGLDDSRGVFTQSDRIGTNFCGFLKNIIQGFESVYLDFLNNSSSTFTVPNGKVLVILSGEYRDSSDTYMITVNGITLYFSKNTPHIFTAGQTISTNGSNFRPDKLNGYLINYP